jgi:sigma-54 dependent transcriptional regulator, acetoin dehydrogenase operon transcriptional activator AcoR
MVGVNTASSDDRAPEADMSAVVNGARDVVSSFCFDEHGSCVIFGESILRRGTSPNGEAAGPGTRRKELDPEGQALLEAAKPILCDVAMQFGTAPMGILLYDARGVVQFCHTGNRQLADELDRFHVSLEFGLAGGAVEAWSTYTASGSGGAAQSLGDKHLVENPEDPVCAGIAIQHPVTREILGGVGLACRRRDAGMTIVPAVATVARRIEDALFERSGRREHALLHDYLRAHPRQGSGVFAISDDLLMMNDQARKLLAPSDHATLLAVAVQALSSGRGQELTIDLPSGGTARVHCRPSVAGPPASAIVEVHLVPQVTQPRARQAAAVQPTVASTVVGSSVLWTKCHQAVDRHFQAREWLILEGEPGTGKSTLARATHQNRAPAAHLRTLEADHHGPGWIAVVIDEMKKGAGTLVLTHLDRLTPDGAAALAEALEPHTDPTALDRPRVIGTVTPRRHEHSIGHARLLALFPRTVEVPPLRHHAQDIEQLVSHLVARLTRGGALRCSPEAMHVLMRNRWPGNIEQLYQVLRSAVAKRRIGTIEVGDLPPECHVTTRRVLTPLEAIECDAIIDALVKTNGDKANAARLLGMSRATMYRKVREYGLTPPGPERG